MACNAIVSEEKEAPLEVVFSIAKESALKELKEGQEAAKAEKRKRKGTRTGEEKKVVGSYFGLKG